MSRNDTTPLAGLLDIAGLISSELEFQPLLKVLAQKTAQICGADRCTFYLMRDGWLHAAMSQYASGTPNPAMWRSLKRLTPLRADDFPGFARALQHDAPVVFTDPATVMPQPWVRIFGIRSGLILPMVRHGRPVGIIHLNNCESARAFDVRDVELGRAIAAQVALIIDNAALIQETRARLRDTEALLRLGQAASSRLDLMGVAREVARAVAEVLGADSSGIFLAPAGPSGEMNGRSLEPFAGHGISRRLLALMRRGPLVSDAFREIAAALDGTRPTMWSDDVPNDPRFAHVIFRMFPAQSILLTRLFAKDESVGVLGCSWRTRRRRFSENELRMVEGIAAQAAMSILNARLYAQSDELAVNRERVRVAQDLHDQLGQTVFSLGLKLEWCLHHMPARSPLRGDLQAVRREAQSIMTQMRQVVSELSPETTPPLDFPARLRELIADFEKLSGIGARYTERGALAAVEKPLEEAVFKALQEGLANVAKHARAGQVWVTVERHVNGIGFTLADDGIGPPAGFTGRTRRDIRGHGLRQMTERLEAIGGHLDFSRNTPSGFVIHGWAPVAGRALPAGRSISA